VTDLLERLERWLRQYAPGPYQSLLPGVTQQELEACQAALAVQLPDALQALYRWRNGQAPRTPPLFADAHSRYSLMTLREAQGAHAGLSEVLGEIEEQGLPGRDTWWHRKWVPFLDAGGDHLCVDAQGTLGGAAGQVVSFFHDDSSRVIEYGSLRDWLQTFVVSLEASLWRERKGTLELLNQEHYAQLAKQMNPGYPVLVHAQP
jgi:cell wall assembly regulator SMI1